MDITITVKLIIDHNYSNNPKISNTIFKNMWTCTEFLIVMLFREYNAYKDTNFDSENYHLIVTRVCDDGLENGHFNFTRKCFYKFIKKLNLPKIICSTKIQQNKFLYYFSIKC